MENRQYDAEGYLKPLGIAIDGEPHKFTHFVKMDVVREGYQVIVDLDRIIELQYTDKHRGVPQKILDKQKGSSFPLKTILVGLAGAVAAWKFRDEIKEAFSEFVNKK